MILMHMRLVFLYHFGKHDIRITAPIPVELAPQVSAILPLGHNE